MEYRENAKPLPDGFSEEQAAEALRRMAAVDDEPGAWLLFIGKAGSGFALTAQGKSFTEGDRSAYLAGTMAALPGLPVDSFRIERSADQRAMIWRFDPPLPVDRQRRFHEWISDWRDDLDFESWQKATPDPDRPRLLANPQPIEAFDPEKPALVHDQLNREVFRWKPEWAATWRKRHRHAKGVVEWDGLLLDSWEPLPENE